MTHLSARQQAVVQKPIQSRLFLHGPAGTGKTSAAVARVDYLLRQGVPGSQVMIFVPQKNLALPYTRMLNHPDAVQGPAVTVQTVGGLARRMVDLYWPWIAEEAGFANPAMPPGFLNIETAQYHLAGLVEPLLREGFFEGVVLDRNRLYSQVLDNLNKAAFVGFPISEISQRLHSAWIEQDKPRRIYQDLQSCVDLFRKYCLEHNLLDFSLSLEVFRHQVWANSQFAAQITSQYPHLVIDNCEEDTPVAHDIYAAWLAECQSALVVYDHDAGYRRFLGADAQNALGLAHGCDEQIELDQSFVTSPAIQAVVDKVAFQVGRLNAAASPAYSGELPIVQKGFRFLPQMLDWVAAEANRLVEEGLPPGDMVIVSPFLSDTMRFSLQTRLQAYGLPVQSHRPSRSLREEPAAQCLLTLAALAHPDWQLDPKSFDVAYALVHAIEGLDLVRAQLLVEVLYRPRHSGIGLLPFDQVSPDMQSRITYLVGQRYEVLRGWLEQYQEQGPWNLAYFFSRLFGDVLSQKGYCFHSQLDSAKVVSNLVDSAREFSLAIAPYRKTGDPPLGRDYLVTVQEGLVAAQYLASWEAQAEDAILIAPASTFLVANRPVTVQFWLNPGSRGWWERLYQPLTHPYVLSRSWPLGKTWSDEDEVAANDETLFRLVTGLLRRCRQSVYLGVSELDEMGGELRGPLLSLLQRVLRRGQI